MDQIAIVGCGAYMDTGYGCVGEWRCLKAATLGEGNFEKPSQVTALVKCECPGRSLPANMVLAIKMLEMKPDKIYLSSCLANAKPGCPYINVEELSVMLERKTGIKVVKGTHDYI
jgi:predicted metal-binding protein